MECFYEKRRQPRSNINIFNITVIPFSRIVMHLFFYNDTINNIKDIYNEERIIEISQGSFYGLFGSWVFISIFILLITVF